jgi:hypothetical protein
MSDVFTETVHMLQFGQVTRYHTELCVKSQDVAQHSFNVAWLCWLLSGKDPSANLLLAALSHDAGERKTGDMPSPTKRSIEGLTDRLDALERRSTLRAGFEGVVITDHERTILKLADLLDGCFYCLREIMMGNRLMVDDLRNGAWLNFMDYTVDYLTSMPTSLAKHIGEELYINLKRSYEHVSR